MQTTTLERTKPRRRTLRLPSLRPFQRQLVAACLTSGTDVVCVAATQIGKSFAYACALVAAAWQDGPNPRFPSWWTSPTYRQSKQGQRITYEVAKSARIRVSGPRPPFATNPPPPLVLANGGVIEFRTFDNPENLMGDPIRRAVIDEGGLMLPDAQSAISTRRSDTLGPLWYIGNPGKRTGPFRRIAARAESEGRLFRFDWRAKHEWLLKVDPEAAKAYEDFIAEERSTIPDFEFRRLYDAEWTEDEAAVFRGVERATSGEPIDWRTASDEERAKPRVVGIDVGQSVDFLAAVGMQRDTRRADVLERFRGIGYPQAAERLKAMQSKLHGATFVLEVNGVGIALAQEFDRIGVSYVPFTTTSQTKQEIILALASDLENERVTLARMPPLQYELEVFRYERMPSGGYRYEAPPGDHDDTVLALALANHGRRMQSVSSLEWI